MGHKAWSSRGSKTTSLGWLVALSWRALEWTKGAPVGQVDQSVVDQSVDQSVNQ